MSGDQGHMLKRWGVCMLRVAGQKNNIPRLQRREGFFVETYQHRRFFYKQAALLSRYTDSFLMVLHHFHQRFLVEFLE